MTLGVAEARRAYRAARATGEGMKDDGVVVSARRRTGPGAVARTCVVTGEVMTLTAVAHGLAGGDLPSLGWLAAMSAGVLAVSLATLRGAIRIRTAVPAICLLQVGLHLSFQAAAAHEHTAHGADQGLALSVPMLFAHLITTAGAAVLLRIQERAIARAREWLDTWRRPRPMLSAPRVRAMPTGEPRRSGSRRVLLLRSPRRGPPTMTSLAP